MLLEDSIRGLSLKINVTLQPVPFSKKTSGDLQAKGPNEFKSAIGQWFS